MRATIPAVYTGRNGCYAQVGTPKLEPAAGHARLGLELAAMHARIERVERHAQHARRLVGRQQLVAGGLGRDDDRRRQGHARPSRRPHAVVGDVAQDGKAWPRERLDE